MKSPERLRSQSHPGGKHFRSIILVCFLFMPDVFVNSAKNLIFLNRGFDFILFYYVTSIFIEVMPWSPGGGTGRPNRPVTRRYPAGSPIPTGEPTCQAPVASGFIFWAWASPDPIGGGSVSSFFPSQQLFFQPGDCTLPPPGWGGGLKKGPGREWVHPPPPGSPCWMIHLQHDLGDVACYVRGVPWPTLTAAPPTVPPDPLRHGFPNQADYYGQ